MGIVTYITKLTDQLLLELDVSPWLHSLVIDGFCRSWKRSFFSANYTCAVFFLSILEDSGYMEVAFVMDKLLRKIGLSGRSLCLSYRLGAVLPAIMATRTLSSERDRNWPSCLHRLCPAVLNYQFMLYYSRILPSISSCNDCFVCYRNGVGSAFRPIIEKVLFAESLFHL